jgi:hypothetical protein
MLDCAHLIVTALMSFQGKFHQHKDGQNGYVVAVTVTSNFRLSSPVFETLGRSGPEVADT